VWEGLGCCGLNTTDIMYQGSFNILALFPELQKRMLRMNARFQREDGRVPHLFLGDLDHVNDQFHRVDMSPQFVMLAWRDYVWTGDLQFLRDLWPHVHKAMDAMARLDHDGDALPDHDTVRNTYDVWDFRGAPAYISSLALGAYAAAARIADAVGEPEVAETWRQALRRGRAAMDAKLWNGAYYSLWVDGAERDECCMTDQLSGEWFAALIGFGPLLDPGRVRQAAQAILRWNFEPEGGLINAVYPPERAPRPSTYLNAQACGNWTGIEYAFASLLFELDLPDEAVAIVKSVDRRHRRAGAIWNHVECGEHYYRAMSSWATLLSATGFKLDAPQARVTFAPRAAGNPFRAPWFAPSGWGLFESDAAGATVSALGGALSLRTLCVEGVRGVVDTVSAGRQPIRAEVRVLEAGVELEFSQPITVAPGRPLVVATR
jgi:uncharacterized protein (DUF608 family)